jgi:transposase InsO family protein
MEISPTISTPTTLFQKVYIDVMSMPPSGGFNFIVAARDDLSGTTEVRAIRSNNSQNLAKFFWEQIYCRYGAIGHVVTDNGSEVKGAFEILLRRMGIPQVRITPYNKHANGVVERGHFTLREAIVKSCDKDQYGGIRNWHKHVEAAMFADRITVSSVTGYSPYYLLHGTHPLLPFDLSEATFMVEGFRSGLSTSELLMLRIRQLERHQEDIDKAAATLEQARFRSKLQFERRFRKRLLKRNYEPGELVLIRNSRLESTVGKFKTEPRYLGPFEVVKRTTKGNYILKELDGTEHAERYAAFRILPYISRNHPFLLGQIDPDDSDISMDSHSDQDSLSEPDSIHSNTNTSHQN